MDVEHPWRIEHRSNLKVGWWEWGDYKDLGHAVAEWDHICRTQAGPLKVAEMRIVYFIPFGGKVVIRQWGIDD